MDTERDTKELFECYADMIYRIGISYGSSVHFAEDVVQEVFLRYLKKRPRFDCSGSAMRTMTGIAAGREKF